MRNRVPIFIAVVALLFCTVLPVESQTTTGRIRGTVTDPDGGGMPGVSITLSDPLKGSTRTVVTGETGDYRFSSLAPGHYTVVAQMDGFEPQTIQALQVSIGGTATANFVISQAFEATVIVSGSPLVDLSSSSASTTFTSEFIEDLPTTRNFYDMISVSPGVSLATEDSDRQVAFGSDVQSNSWHIDGIETTAPETGTAWVYVNPDMVEEIQIMGVGAPAEYGNLLGAAFNVVTKSGTNEFHGTASTHFFDDNLVDSDLAFKESEFQEYHQDKFQDFALTLGGPVVRDKLWFFAAYEYWRDNHSFPGSDPSMTNDWFADRYDLKLSAQLNDNNLLELKGYSDEWGYPDPASEFVTPSAQSGQEGKTTAWGVSLESMLSNNTYLEARYAGWNSDDDHLSQTGSTETAFIDWTPEGGGPPLYSGGVYWPWTYDTSIDQISLSVSHFADDFLKGDHDFKFGVMASQGEAVTLTTPSATGNYYYRYLYEYDYYGYIYEYNYYVKVTGEPYFYGNEQDSWAVFVDDSWAVSDRLTLNLGLRFDHHEGVIPSLSRPGSGETIPGVSSVFKWDKVSPRFGFAYVAGEQRKTVIRGSAGVYFDGNVGGNWNSPPPQPPVLTYSASLSGPDGPFDIDWGTWSAGLNNVDPNLEPPKTLQYSIGFEREFREVYSFGLMAVYKDTSDMIGWEFLNDAVFETFEFTDPINNRVYTLWEIEDGGFPTTRKGNGPGYTAAGFFPEYWQEYYAIIASFNRRFTDFWDMSASYTYSKSEGLNTRALAQYQNNPLYGSKEGSHPNQWFNVDGQDQLGDRPHMFRVQANFELPWDMHANTAINIQSGRPYSRQVRAPYNTAATRQDYFVADHFRHPTQSLVDFTIGKRFGLPADGKLRLALQFFNLLNNDATDWFETLVLAPGDSFRPNWWVKPRRLMIRVGVEY